MSTTTRYIFTFSFLTFVWAFRISFSCFSQTTNTFMRTFQAAGMNGGLSLAETNDGGFVGTGQHGSSGAGSCDIYVYKVDGCGNPEWFKTYGGTGEDGGKAIQQTTDGGYIVTGLAFLGAGDYDITLLKLDASGNLQWSKVYGGGAADYGLYVQQTSDSGYVISGFMSGLGFGAEDVALIKTDANGNTQWMKVYGGAGSDWGDYVEQTSDGGYKVVGYTTSFGAGSYDIYVLKLDSSGSIQWAKTYGGASGEGSSQWGISGKTTADGGFMVCANTTSFGSGSNDVLLIKTDNSGAVVWAKTYGGAADEQPRFALETRDHGFSVFGYTTSFGAGDLDAYLIKTDSLGNLEWSKAYGGPAYDKGAMAREAPDGGYALSIVTASFGANYYDPLFMKTDSLGEAGCNETNAATIVQNITPTVGSGGSETIPTATIATPSITTNIFSPTDIYLCQHCTTVPTFVPSDTNVCVNDTVWFYNTTSVGKRCFEDWYINNTLITADKDTLPFVFNTVGLQQIQLIAKCGNTTDTNTIYIHVIAPPVASFTNTTVCKNNATQFTNTSTTPGTIVLSGWDFGDGSPVTIASNPTHIYPDSGSYNVTLVIQSSYGCLDTAANPVHVYGLPTAGFSNLDVCIGDSMPFTNTSVPNSGATLSAYSWDFGDGSPANTNQNPSHLYSSPDTYTVTLIVTTNNGCKDTISKNIVVHPLPVPQFSTANVCYGYYASFNESSSITNTDTIQSWTWNFGDSTPLLFQQQVTGGHLYTAAATYNVQLLVSSTFGCADSVTHPIIIYPKPVADFTDINKCDGTAVPFSDSSTTASGSTISSWNWNFGDGSPADATQNPSHLYPNAGNFSTTLIIQNNFTCADTVTKPIVVYFNPIANFTVLDVCLNDSVFFNDSSYVDTSAVIASWLWVFGDGSPTGGVQNPAHFFNLPANYGVTLLVTTNQNCVNAVNRNVNVFDPPVADFNVANCCLVDSALFNNTSNNPSMGTIASWTWNFGDVTPLNTTDLNPLHLYADTGTYTITLITRSSNLACADTAMDTLTVFPMPVADFTAAEVCLGQNMSFFDSSSVTGTSFMSAWIWNFDDNSSLDTLQNPVHTYDDFGAYTVTFFAQTNHNCKDTATNTVVVHPLPDALFSTYNVCFGDTAVFTDLSTVLTNPTYDSVVIWNWDFGDNSPVSNTQNTAHLYAAIGTDSVQLNVLSSFGCADSTTKTIVINPNPLVSFTTSDTIGCEPLCIDFSNSSTIATGNNNSWIWNFGDGNTAANNTLINHCFFNDSVFNPKFYTISLTVTSDSGCVTSLTKTNHITVFPKPDAGFSVIPTSASIINPVVAITDLSTGANSWFWNFGDGSAPLTTGIDSASVPIPHTYSDTGAYTISLITTTQYNCIDTAFQTVIIEPDFTFFIPTAFSPNDDGVNDTFIGRGIFINAFEMSIFDRWGNLIYRTDDMNKPWNGKANYGNELAQPDVYIYSIKIIDFKLKKYNYKGIVTLVR